MSTRVVSFQVEDEADVPGVIERLLAAFSIRRAPETSEDVRWLDTFDSRLFERGASLAYVESGGERVLRWSGGPTAPRRRLRVSAGPAFAGDVPASAVHDELEPLAEMRRLLTQVEVRSRCDALDVVNEDEKIVARITLRSRRARGSNGKKTWHDAPARLVLGEVRGYGAEFERVERFVRHELRLEAVGVSELEDALRAIGARPRRSFSAPEFQRGMPAAPATKMVLSALLEAMVDNESGLRSDLDTEFLHDFRVAVRRTRSILTQVKGVFAKTLTKHYGSEFRWLGQVTGLTRDLDVFLLKSDDYLESLDAEPRAALAPLLEFMAALRVEEQRKMTRKLGTDRYQNLVRNWRAFLAEESTNGALQANAFRPVEAVVSARILRRFRRIVSAGRAIPKDAPVERLHALRIECKKLRYLLELFGSLYPPREIKRSVKELKRLQNLLGDLNDYEVHVGTVERAVGAMSRRGACFSSRLRLRSPG